MKGSSYALKNGDVLQHWSSHNYDRLYSTEIAQYPGNHKVVSAFFMLYRSGTILPTETPGAVQFVIGGKAYHVYEISAATLINTHINTNQFQVYPRDSTITSGVEAIIVMGCGNSLVFPSNNLENRAKRLTVHHCTGFDILNS